MATFLVVALALFAAVSASPARIIGGSSTTVENFPSIVQVESLTFGLFWSHSCAGSILNSVFILSAAHCFSGTGYAPESRRIRAGTSNLETGGVIVHVAQENNHPTYGLNGNDGDITVVRLSSALIFSPTIQAGSIITAGSTFPGGLTMIKAGWGSTEVGGQRAQQLQAANVVTFDRQFCALNYAALTSSPPVTENMICAGSTAADACEGDGGGPLYFSGIIVGVISWGNGCVVPGFPGVTTAVSSYTTWIIATTAA